MKITESKSLKIPKNWSQDRIKSFITFEFCNKKQKTKVRTMIKGFF